MTDSVAIGVDGCRGGWLAVIAAGSRLTISKRPTFHDLADPHPKATIVVDVPIGFLKILDRVVANVTSLQGKSSATAEAVSFHRQLAVTSQLSASRK